VTILALPKTLEGSNEWNECRNIYESNFCILTKSEEINRMSGEEKMEGNIKTLMGLNNEDLFWLFSSAV
jgi:hypothetical protein